MGKEPEHLGVVAGGIGHPPVVQIAAGHPSGITEGEQADGQHVSPSSGDRCAVPAERLRRLPDSNLQHLTACIPDRAG